MAELRANFKTLEPSLLTAVAQMKCAVRLLSVSICPWVARASACSRLTMASSVILHSLGQCLSFHPWVISHGVSTVCHWLELDPHLALLSVEDSTDYFLNVRREA